LKKKSGQLKRLLKDNLSGSAELLIKLNKLIKQNSKDPEELKAIYTFAKKKFSDFSAINNYLENFTSILKYSDSKMIKDFTESFIKETENKRKRLLENVYNELKNYKKFLTLSNSKTVLDSLKYLHSQNRKLKITISESRPANEGRILAKHLLKEKIKIEFIIEAELSQFIPLSDAVIIGADSVLKNGNVINKTGSKSAAILCKHFNIPFYVITSKDKLSEKESYLVSEKKPAEIWKYKNNKLKIHNYYFEEIDNNLITKIITD
jgi:translation initiation factor 2B subunit (eIF-2B alpha/beta/delta family)